MHAVIINGSPRVQKNSNTDKILKKFTKGMEESGSTFELYSLSDRKVWESAREAYYYNTDILIALPLFVECIPGLLLEFLETLSPKDKGTTISFILQSGFAEGVQLRCGEEFLKKLASELNCTYGGTLVKGNNFGIRFLKEEKLDKETGPYMEMGRVYGRRGDFLTTECRKFTGPEIYPAPLRFLLGIIFKTGARKMFLNIADELGCSSPLDDRPFA